MRRPDTNVAGAVAGAGGTAHRPELASRGLFETATAAVKQAERLGLEVHPVSPNGWRLQFARGTLIETVHGQAALMGAVARFELAKRGCDQLMAHLRGGAA